MFADYDLYEAGQNALRHFFGAAALGYGTLSQHAKFLGLPAASREFEAAGQMIERGIRTYGKPAFNLARTNINGADVAVREDVVVKKPYCNLLHFERDTARHDPKVLLVAPMSGHYATLLRGTVEALLPHHDVYITDWINARDVSPEHGGFGLGDYAEYVKNFLRHLGPDTHVMAVCQSVVPVLAAVAQMATSEDMAQPLSMTLMGGPVDARAAPTAVTKFAERHPMEWFERNALSNVPYGHAGFGQVVYPGFKQLTGFMAMNPERHSRSHRDLFNHLRQGDRESAAKIMAFYDEYLAVMDIPAKFYLETVDQVFKRHLLPKGEMILLNQGVEPGHVRKTALLTVEGGKDDISAAGQTAAAHVLCNNLAPEKHFSFVHPDVGHYGIFEGRRWRNDIMPRLAAFFRKQGVDNRLKYDEIPSDSRPMPSISEPR
jgi:poly(3-hydroxybutyrate) depolymerase